ncbi:hypothetical protein ISS39_04660 [Candidatus Bathyarchaeota archaeon]|nr:hypothetical protein [Candidatus Bathyarchaeota archaeon]
MVNEIIEALDDHDIVFLVGGVGTGKSAIALHIIDHYGKGIISTPTKILERQYTEDYCGTQSMRVGDPDGSSLNINLLMGRTNFPCPNPPRNLKRKPIHSGDRRLPCVRRLPEGVSRCAVGAECPLWSPVYVPGSCTLLERRGRDTIEYTSITGKKVYYRAEEPCPYYAQFIHFTRPGAIIMNSAKWEAETWLGRKPRVPVEIIDEGDEYLDGLTYRTSVTRRLYERIRREGLVDDDTLRLSLEHFQDTLDRYGQAGYDGFLQEEENIAGFLADFIDMLEGAEPSDFVLGIKTRIRLILENQEVSWVRTNRDPPNPGVTVFLPSPGVTLRELAKRSGKMVFMSATIHEPDSLTGIFKMDAPMVVEAESRFPGTLMIMVPPEGHLLPRVTYRTWRDQKFREGYWEYLDDVIEAAAKPCLVQVHAFRYLPEKYRPSPDQRREEYWGFGEAEVMFSTKTDRGIDLRDEECRSIVIMKYPFPNTEDVVFRTMRKLLGEDAFWAYLRDIADRNLVQQCGRAVRHRDDWCEIYTLDGEVLRRLPSLWRGKYVLKEVPE